MEDSLRPLTAAASGPRLAVSADTEGPIDFVPMRLLLQPGGFSVELTKPQAIVGRHGDADVRLTLSDISRRHCRFVFSDGSWKVFDLNSMNGVFVNGVKLHEATIAHGDRVQIGSLVFEVELDNASQRPPLKKAS